MKAIIAVFVLSVVSGSFAMARDCQQANSNYEIYECMKLQYTAADKVLNVEYQNARARISKSVMKPEDKTASLQILLKAQRAWIAFRDTDCDLQSIAFMGGNGGGLQIQQCLVSKTQERTAILKDVASGRENPSYVTPE